MFIQGGTFIPDSRVKLVLLKAHKRSRQAFNSLKSKKAFWQGQGFSVERMVNSEFEGCEFGGRHGCTHIYEGETKTKQKPGEYRLINLL